MSSLMRAGTALGRGGAALVAVALAITLTAGSASARTAATSPAGRGATWLSDQLTRGLIHNNQYDFDDYGLSIDTAFALKTIGGHSAAVARIRTAMTKHVSDYTTDASFGESDVFANAIAKLLVFAQTTGGGAKHFGGTNLVSKLQDRVITSGPSRGRIQDVVDPTNTFGDSANTIGQIFAVRGLLKAGSPLAKPALRFLLEQQCPVYFRLDFNPDKTATNQACTRKSPADTDVTALAVIELWSLRRGHPDLVKSLDVASQWLTRHQRDNGSFGGGPSTSAANTNSTGLAAWALGAAGRCRAAGDAAAWVSRLQVGGHLAGTPLARERGAIAYDRAALTAAQRDGITKQTRDQWRRATAQAAPGLLLLGGRHCR
jgi:hypothetical protein